MVSRLPSAPLPDHCRSRYTVRVRFTDTDLMGIAHHANYLTYFEAARVEYMRRRGLAYDTWVKLGFHLPVVEARIRYRKTARFDELLTVEARLTELTRVRVRFDYVLERRDGAGPPEILADGFTLLACVGQDHRLSRMPAQADAILRGPETHPRPDDCV